MLVQLDGKQLPMKDFVEDFVARRDKRNAVEPSGVGETSNDFHPNPAGGG